MEYLSGEKGSKYPLLILKSPETDSERVPTLEVLFWDICFVIVIDEDDKSTEETFLFDKLNVGWIDCPVWFGKKPFPGINYVNYNL